MNSSVYLFGNFSSGYTQYPDEDFSASIFQTFYQKSKATTQIAIHRDGHLVYYCYIRKLEQNQYIGLCVLLNDAMITNFSNLFELYENLISYLAEKGYFIRYNEHGNLVSNTEYLFKKIDEIEIVTESLRKGFDNLANNATDLPPENFSVEKDSTKEFTVEDDAYEILRSSHINGFTYIYKSKGFDTAQMTSFKGVLAKVSKENVLLKKENKDIKEENKKIKRQKKQFLYVIILFIILISCGIGILSLNNNLRFTQNRLDEANDIISVKDLLIKEKNSLITCKNDTIKSFSSNILKLQSSLVDEQSKRENAEQDLKNLKGSVSSSLPILITSIDVGNIDKNNKIVNDYGSSIYSYNTMYLSPRIKYTGIRSGESITLYVKLYNASGALSTGNSSPLGYSFFRTITISSGEDNTVCLNGWGSGSKGHWAKGTYRFEFWYGDMCLKAKTFTIY